MSRFFRSTLDTELRLTLLKTSPSIPKVIPSGSDSEDSDDETSRKRQARSQKDKRLEEMENAVKAIENGQRTMTGA
ncbi:unnamed protein product [Rhizopus microsporus]